MLHINRLEDAENLWVQQWAKQVIQEFLWQVDLTQTGLWLEKQMGLRHKLQTASAVCSYKGVSQQSITISVASVHCIYPHLNA